MTVPQGKEKLMSLLFGVCQVLQAVKIVWLIRWITIALSVVGPLN